MVSVVKINGLRKEKLGHLVEQQTGFFGNILPKLLEQATERPLVLQNLEQPTERPLVLQNLDQPTERPLVLQNFEQQEIEEEPVSQRIQYRLKRLAKLRGKGIRIPTERIGGERFEIVLLFIIDCCLL